MNNERHDNKIYTAEDLARYHSGRMSSTEMYALERAALEDPFLADALEGLEQRSTMEAAEDMDELKKRLARRIGGKKHRLAFPIYRVGIAAAVFLLAGSLSLLYFLNKADEQSNDVIVQETPLLKADTALAVPVGPPVADESGTMPAASARKKKAPSTGNINKAAEPESISPVNPGRKEEESVALLREQDSKDKDDLSRKLPPPADATSVQKPAPVAARAPAKASEEGLSRMQKMKVENKPAVSKPDTSLQEVVVVGYGSQKKNIMIGSVAKPPQTLVVSVSPVGSDTANAPFRPVDGWANYKTYIQENIGTDIEWRNKHGEIILSFSIDRSGSSRYVKVEKSPDETLNTEIILLLTNGPKWTLMAGNESLVRISVIF